MGEKSNSFTLFLEFVEHFRFDHGIHFRFDHWKTTPEQKTKVPPKKNTENEYWKLMRQKHAQLYICFSPQHMEWHSVESRAEMTSMSDVKDTVGE